MTTTTVQQFRHDVRSEIKDIQAGSRALAMTDATRKIHEAFSPSLQLLSGRSGYTQEEQVNRLTQVQDKLPTLDELNTLVQQAREEIKADLESKLALVDTFGDDFFFGLGSIVGTLIEAKKLAETRDFDAHQKRKDEARWSADSYEEEDYADEDLTE